MTSVALSQGAPDTLARLLAASEPEVRAAAVCALGCLVQAGTAASATSAHQPSIFAHTAAPNPAGEAARMAAERALACHLLQASLPRCNYMHGQA